MVFIISFIFAMMLRRIISILLFVIYAVIVTHDFVPHHHHTDVCTSHHHHHHHHGDCEHSHDDCQFPYHQHSLDEAGVFLNNSGITVNFELHNLSPKNLFDYEDVLTYSSPQHQIAFIPPVYKGPDLTSATFRGPPVS